MKIVTIVGARPQFIKAAPVSQALRQKHSEVLVHTGQHYDENMSGVFFEELGIPAPDYNLGVGSGPHGSQTGSMLAGIEKVLIDEKPDWVLIYGDTNSTLAGALAGAKLHIPVAHVEAGLRSYNRQMPEEINRVVADHLSTLLLCPSDTAVKNLELEGIHNGVYEVGDVMYQSLMVAVERSRTRPDLLNGLGLAEKGYLLVTVHRAENTDSSERLQGILNAFAEIKEPILFPVHPRTRKVLEDEGYIPPPHLRLVEPFGYLDMARLEDSARMILTDSGGIQKEAYWLGVPCVTLRDETEWPETVQVGWNVLAGANKDKILKSVCQFNRPDGHPHLYGDNQVAQRCIDLLERSEVL